jgi:hypothetical protein
MSAHWTPDVSGLAATLAVAAAAGAAGVTVEAEAVETVAAVDTRSKVAGISTATEKITSR